MRHLGRCHLVMTLTTATITYYYYPVTIQLLSSYTPVWTTIINDNTSFQTSHAQPPVSWSGPLKPIRQQVLTTRRKPSLLGQLRQRWLKMFHWFSLNHYVIEQRPVCLELKPCLKAFSSCNFSRRVVEMFHIAWPRRRSMRPRVGLFCMLPYGLRKRNSPWANGVEMTFADFAKTLAPEVDLQLELFLFGEVSQVSCAVLHTSIFDLLVSKNKEYLLSYARSQQLKASTLRVSRALLRFQDYTQKAFKDMQLSLKV